jgi:hypothetical protein
VVASRHSLDDVLKKAQQLFPDRPLTDIAVFAVPVILYTLYFS